MCFIMKVYTGMLRIGNAVVKCSSQVCILFNHFYLLKNPANNSAGKQEHNIGLTNEKEEQLFLQPNVTGYYSHCDCIWSKSPSKTLSNRWPLFEPMCDVRADDITILLPLPLLRLHLTIWLLWGEVVWNTKIIQCTPCPLSHFTVRSVLFFPE